MEERGFVVENIDATIIAQRPKLATYRPLMAENIGKALKLSTDRVSVKATTEEGLGFTGRGEGISAQAVAGLETIENYSYPVGAEEGRCAGCGGCSK